jgi:hypothetical protein
MTPFSAVLREEVELTFEALLSMDCVKFLLVFLFLRSTGYSTDDVTS